MSKQEWFFYKETPTYFVYKRVESCCGLTDYKNLNKSNGEVTIESYPYND